jgi:hypothetical protein
MLRPLAPTPACFALSILALVASSSLAACHSKASPTPTAPTPSASSSSRADLFASADDLLAPPDLVGDAASDEAPHAGPGADPSGAPTIVLKNPGAEPRAPLTYDFAPGKAQTATLGLTTTVKQDGDPTGGGGDEQMPPLRLTLSVVAGDEASPAGTLFQVHVTKAEVAPGARGVPPEAAAEMRELSKVLATIGATVAVSKRGVIQDVDFSGDPEAQNAASSVLALLEDAFALFFVPVPEEAVGVGAEWTTTSETPPGAPRGALSKTYTLKARTPTTATVDVAGQQLAPEQPFRDPQAPPGLTIAVASKETFTVRLRLTGIASKGSSDGETVITTRDPSASPPHAVVAHMKRSQRLDAP